MTYGGKKKKTTKAPTKSEAMRGHSTPGVKGKKKSKTKVKRRYV